MCVIHFSDSPFKASLNSKYVCVICSCYSDHRLYIGQEIYLVCSVQEAVYVCRHLVSVVVACVLTLADCLVP